VFYLLTNNPVSHGVDIESRDIAAEPVGFDERRAAAHEWIGNSGSFQIVSPVKYLRQRFIDKLGKQ